MNVAPGDLALVVSPNKFAQATCTVIRLVEPSEVPDWFLAAWAPCWHVEFPRPMNWDSRDGGASTCGAIPDAHLRRLAGPSARLDVEREKKNGSRHSLYSCGWQMDS